MRVGFEFHNILNEGLAIKKRLVQELEGVNDEKLNELAKEASKITFSGEASDRPALNIAVIGQYDAGKSTIISALTGRKDVVIDADVSTDKITAYDWNGIILLDTPGIYSGYQEHDEITYAAIDRADLLVFVITNELFDDTIGKHFRELAFNRNKAKEILLVINKMGQDPGTPEVKIPDIEKVISPLKIDDLPIVFIDSKSYLEAEYAFNEEEKEELIEISNFNQFITALNFFVEDKGLVGRLTTPLFVLRTIAEQALGYLSAEYPEEKNVLELLHRKQNIFLTSKSRLRRLMIGLVEKAATDITHFGDEVAGKIEPGSNGDEIERVNELAQQKIEQRCQLLSDEAKDAIENELNDLNNQLEMLRNGVLARELLKSADSECGKIGENGFYVNRDVTLELAHKGKADWINKAKKISQVADNIGKLAAKWATGTVAEGIEVGTQAAARGSDAHKAVYNVGKFFGVKFKPWGAVKVARAIGNAGRIVAAVGGVVAVFAQIAEDNQQEEYRIQLRDARDGVRTYYGEAALEIQKQFTSQLDGFIEEFYGSEIAAISETANEIISSRKSRDGNSQNLNSIISSADIAIKKIQKMH